MRGGRPADRTPTLEQLVAAFGEAEPTVDARRRAARALALAGVADGARPARGGAGPAGRCSRSATCAGAARCCWACWRSSLLFAAAAALATQVDFGDDNTAADLPADTTTTAAPTTATDTR